MNYIGRPVDQPNSSLRTRNMTVKVSEIKPNNVKSSRKLETKQAVDLNFDNIDATNDNDLLYWLEKQSENEDFRYRGLKILKIDRRNNIITVYNSKKGKEEEITIKTFLKTLSNDVLDVQGKNKLDGKSTTNEKIIDMIESDIKTGHLFKGKKIVAYDKETGYIYIEGGMYGMNTKMPLTDFIEQYKQERKINSYGDSVEDSQELARQQNIDDLTTAFKNALGIKPAKVKYFAPLKITRGIQQTPNNYRDYDFNWSEDEIMYVRKLGKTPNPNKKVDGVLHDTFNPVAPQPQPSREAQPFKEFARETLNSSRYA